ncbi:coronin-2B isoform X5 [Daphnia magna]|uniref:Coronin n=2 Tax=Daphnia magna TaxID=35525 RepID=A0A0P5Y5K6_9CRUS|nr:coronin-2B isoform X5 [Daphnia magna]XP_045029973.1 coronin-2B isoform X5 [Daphnia magna]XP_045029975.1 coronin-2B isoform X5 [Daphnia magna]KZS05188.1 Coronin-1C [Daphnia magna]
MTNTSQLSFRGVRASKFRHVYGQTARKDKCYENVKITKDAHDSNCCAANPKFLAIITEVAGGGAFIVLPLEKTGRLDLNVGKVTGHAGPVLDIKWNPFNDNVIASASEDCTVKLWHIPDGGFTENVQQWLVELRGHKRRCTYIEWHPTADNVLLSAGSDHLIFVWNVGTSTPINIIKCHPDVIYSMSFNRDGSLLATTCKDKQLRILDPRTGRVIKEGICHVGSKSSKVVYLGDTGRLFTTGFSRQSDRQYALWSQDDLSTPLRCEMIDSSSGILIPYYDPDTRMIYVAGKGDGNIRYYEIVDEEPWIHYLTQFLSGSPQRGLGYMPKRGVQTQLCETFRFYKLHATRGLCEPISMIVPRKSETYQDDLYPDTAAPTPALTAEEWIKGINRDPVLMSMKTGSVLPHAVRTFKPVRYDPVERKLQTSDKNNDKKFAFITQETVVDYRPVERAESGFHDMNPSTDEDEMASSDSHENDEDDDDEDDSDPTAQRERIRRNHVWAIISLLEEQAKGPYHLMMRAADAKAAKTSCNLGTKFQQTQQMWSRPTRSMTQLNMVSPTNGIHKANSIGIGSIGSIGATNQRAISGSAFITSEKAIEIIDAPLQGTELRRAYDAQGEEIRRLKQQLVLKDRRIHELEEQLQRFKMSFITDSTA